MTHTRQMKASMSTLPDLADIKTGISIAVKERYSTMWD